MKLRSYEKARNIGCPRALSVGIYESKSIGNCSNDGISAHFNEILIPCPTGNWEIDWDNPPENLCIYVERELWGERHDYIRPYKDAVGVGWMFGGSLVYTSDGRYSAITEDSVCCPMKLHDRDESQELYDMLSR